MREGRRRRRGRGRGEGGREREVEWGDWRGEGGVGGGGVEREGKFVHEFLLLLVLMELFVILK